MKRISSLKELKKLEKKLVEVRGCGRTTGEVLGCLGEAIKRPGQPILVRDHSPNMDNKYLERYICEIIYRLGFEIEVARVNGGIQLTSFNFGFYDDSRET